MRAKTEQDYEIVSYLQDVSHKLYVAKEQLEKEEKLLTAMAVRSRYTGEDDERTSLLQLMDYHNTEMRDELRWGTLKNYFTTQAYI